jgi:N-acyl-D-amino-acid deacylase
VSYAGSAAATTRARKEATYANPHRYPSGARTTVIVNGTVVVENATHTGALPGVVLRRGADGSVG